jgi:hypothetical protein
MLSFHGKQVPYFLPLIHDDVQVNACRQQARMPGRGLHLSQRSAAGKCVADKRVTAVMDSQRAKAIPA